MPMFEDFQGAGRILLDLNGDTVEYISNATGSIFVQGVIDESPSVEDPGKSGGRLLQAGTVLGYVEMEDILNPRHGDLIKYNGRTWTVSDPHDGGGGLWEFTLREDFDD